MRKIVKAWLLTISVISLQFPQTVSAQTAWGSNCWAFVNGERIATIRGVECMVANILVIALRLIGIALFIMLIMGGYKLLTAGGDPKAVEAGKQTITLAIGGLIMAIMSWFVLVLISNVTGIGEELLQFNLNFAP